jgi:hypothetical protein
MKFFLKVSAAFFVIFWVILTAQVFWVCIPEQTWKQQALPQCVLGNNVGIAQVISPSLTLLHSQNSYSFAAYIAADAILIYAPIQLIWCTRFPPSIKIRLITVFAATVITTVASLYYIYTLLKVRGIAEDFAAVIQVRSVA